ncbi:MAG: GTP cyclohydrolase, FolE2/MptA family, partial [Pseudomonadota bacterium]
EFAHLELSFPYFINKKAPVSGQLGKLDISVTFECSSNHVDDFIMGIKVPATSLCPCSKEISQYGAHNQRCEMEARVRFAPGASMWIEELFELVEQCASTQVFAVLKRPDEKYVTEAAYDNPKFVEDIVRDLAIALEGDDRIAWYEVASENFESIHNHNAYAVIEKDKRESAD